LWKHDTRPIIFSLVVDDFGVKYVGKENAPHLLDTVRGKTTNAPVTGRGSNTADLPSNETTTDEKSISLCRGTSAKPSPAFNTPLAKRQDQPYPHVKPNYGAKKQYAPVEDASPALNKAGKKFIQEVCRVFLFLARVVDGLSMIPNTGNSL